MASNISLDTETKIVAYLARGDTYLQIKAELGVAEDTISAVKKRNAESLSIIKENMQQRAAEDALSIKLKANTALAKRLERQNENESIINKARIDYQENQITLREFEDIIKHTTELTVQELVSVSREMHSQSAVVEKPPASPADMASLIAAIRSGDEVSITKAVFKSDKS